MLFIAVMTKKEVPLLSRKSYLKRKKPNLNHTCVISLKQFTFGKSLFILPIETPQQETFITEINVLLSSWTYFFVLSSTFECHHSSKALFSLSFSFW